MSQRDTVTPTAPGVAVVATTIPLTVAKFHGELLRQLQERGYDVCVVSSPGEHLLTVTTWGYRTVALPMTRDISPAADLRALSRWLRLLRRERPMLLVTATPKASLLGQLAGRIAGVPRRLYFLGGLRLEGAAGWHRRVLTAVERVTMGAATEVVVNSQSLEACTHALHLTRSSKLRRTYPGSSHGVDTGFFAPRARDDQLSIVLGLEPGLPVLGFVGRLTADKGIDCLVAAATTLRERGLRAQWLIVGPHDEHDSRDSLHRLANSNAPIVVTGFVDDIRPYLALMDANVLPSRREGFPNVVLEAAAMGVPSITTTATGCVDSVVDGVTGLLFETDDSQALANAITRVLADDVMRARMGLAARRRAVECFRPEMVVRSILLRRHEEALSRANDTITNGSIQSGF